MVEPALFDTNIVIDILAGIQLAREEYDRYSDRAISIITWMEVMSGVHPDEAAKVLRFLATFVQLLLSPAIAEQAVDVRRTSRLKLPDAIILATAQVEKRILLTRNTKDFKPDGVSVRVPYQI